MRTFQQIGWEDILWKMSFSNVTMLMACVPLPYDMEDEEGDEEKVADDPDKLAQALMGKF